MRYISLVAILLVMAVPVFGASSFVGPSGNIVTPDDVVVPPGVWELAFHRFQDIFGGTDLNVFSLNYGIMENLEVGVSFLNNSDDEVIFNGKFRILPETATQPSLLIGVLDVAGTVGVFGDDPSFYIVASKDLSGFLGVPDAPQPFRLSVGFGSGLYNGIFAGVDWTAAPRLSLMVEFVNNDLSTIGIAGTNVNAGARFALTDTIRIDAALIDFSDIAFGASLRAPF